MQDEDQDDQDQDNHHQRGARKPFELRLKLQTALSFRLEVDDFSSVSMSPSSSSTPSLTSWMTVRLLKSQVEAELVEDNHYHSNLPSSSSSVSVDGFAMATAAVTSLMVHDTVPEVLELFGQSLAPALVPVPIGLPWPFNVIKVTDFGLHVLDQLWVVDADFALDPQQQQA